MENKIDYLRGKDGFCVGVIPTGYGSFVVKIFGHQWSEILNVDGEWGGSGTLRVFKTYDEALDVGIYRVKELMEL